MNTKFKKILLLIGLVSLIVIGIIIIPRAISIFYQVRGGQQIEYLLRSYEDYPDLELACEQLFSKKEEVDEVEEAIADLDLALRFNRKNAQAYYYLGKAYCVLGNPTKAKENYFQYTQLRPLNPLGFIGLGFAYEELGDSSAASNAWRSADLTASDFNQAGDEEFKVEEYENAITWYERSLFIEPQSAETLLKLGKVYEVLKDSDHALELFYHAWDLDPELSTSALIDAYMRVGDFNAVEQVIQQMLEEYPTSSERIKWWDSLGEVLYLNNNWIEAILTYEEALKEFPVNVKFHINLGWAYYESGAGVKPALDQFNKLIDLVPESGGGEYSIARLLTREKLYTEADEYFQEALIKNPEPDWWYLERANTAIKAQNIPLAIEIYKGLIERNPNYSPAYFGIAKSYQQANQLRQAVSSIDTALNLTNSPSYNQYVLSGEIYEWAGEKEKALNAYTQAFIVNPDSESALEAINRIKK